MSLTRRDFLKAASASLLLGPLAGRALAERPPAPKALVSIFLRGGADGLNLVVPYKDPGYAALRRAIRIPAPGTGTGPTAIDLDGFFGVHPALSPFARLFSEKKLAIVHAVSYPEANRSHFEEQDVWETAIPKPDVRADGWLNRWLGTHEGCGPLRAVALGDTLPRQLRGAVGVQSVQRIEELRLSTPEDRRARTLDALAGAYAAGGEAGEKERGLAETGQGTLSGIEALRELDPSTYAPENGAAYPQTGLAGRLRQAAQLLKSDVGVEVISTDLGGWDTHQDQGGVAGQQANLARELSEACEAFTADMGGRMRDVLVLVASEFGRTGEENGTGGTDHGHGNCLFLIGGGVLGGRVHGTWPGLAKDKLVEQRDLAHTTDFRDVYAEVITYHLGRTRAGAILPEHRPRPVGLFYV